jgi:hypothetical protein
MSQQSLEQAKTEKNIIELPPINRVLNLVGLVAVVLRPGLGNVVQIFVAFKRVQPGDFGVAESGHVRSFRTLSGFGDDARIVDPFDLVSTKAVADGLLDPNALGQAGL